MKDYTSLIKECREIVECDSARITDPCGKLFLIIGFNANTADDPGEILRNGEPFDYDYLKERVIASGNNERELLESVREYARISKLTMEEYISELLTKPKE
jgi:hypothetical protein